MSTEDNPAFVLDKPRRGCSLFAAALVSWALVTVTAVLLFVTGPWPALSKQATTHAAIVSWVVVGAVYGPPFAFAVCLAICFAVGYPAWIIAGEHGLTRRRDAATVGALAGFVLYVGWATFSFVIPGVHPRGDVSTWVVQELLFHLCASLYITAVGAAAGLAAWAAGGEKSVLGGEKAV